MSEDKTEMSSSQALEFARKAVKMFRFMENAEEALKTAISVEGKMKMLKVEREKLEGVVSTLREEEIEITNTCKDRLDTNKKSIEANNKIAQESMAKDKKRHGAELSVLQEGIEAAQVQAQEQEEAISLKIREKNQELSRLNENIKKANNQLQSAKTKILDLVDE